MGGQLFVGRLVGWLVGRWEGGLLGVVGVGCLGGRWWDEGGGDRLVGLAV